MRQAVVGLLAHVDAGKTTLAEAMLATAGAIRNPGRVDSGSSHLDTDDMERDRGITIFSATAALDWAGSHLMLVDAPGHVDFSAEAERTLAALDYAILVVGANDGVQGHTETLWDLLARHEVPTFVFVNKCDLTHPGREGLLAELASRLSPGCVDASALLAGDSGASEDAAGTQQNNVVVVVEGNDRAPAPPASTVVHVSDDYILPYSATYEYSTSEISHLSDWELYLARNEIYARHGREFRNDDLVRYFGDKSWYTPIYSPDDFDARVDSFLSYTEQRNAATILALEQARGSAYI